MAQLQNDSAENEISSRDQFDVKVISSREYETDTDCIYKHNSLDLMVFATLELHEKNSVNKGQSYFGVSKLRIQFYEKLIDTSFLFVTRESMFMLYIYIYDTVVKQWFILFKLQPTVVN